MLGAVIGFTVLTFTIGFSLIGFTDVGLVIEGGITGVIGIGLIVLLIIGRAGIYGLIG